MKKISALLLAGVMAATALAGCGGSNSTTAKGSSETENDWTYIQNKGEFVIGITYFEPMNYMDENGNLTGFETEFATKVCEKMGVTPKFQKIDWDSKEVELNAKTIDCIWNGLTITEERQENMSISTPYMENKQVMVAKADIAISLHRQMHLRVRLSLQRRSQQVKRLPRVMNSLQAPIMFQLTHRQRLCLRLSQAQLMLRLSTM